LKQVPYNRREIKQLVSSSPHILTNQLLEFASQPISAEEILDDLNPPKHFDKAEFSNYIPEKEYPSQSLALQSVEQFISNLQKPPSLKSRFWKSRSVASKGIYLDGGFGVGKTHLLAAAFHKFSGSKAYLSFQELMFLVGLQSLNGVAASLKDVKLLIIDEFELDDPANTRIVTNLLGQLFDSGVSILTSSNTPPGALGEGKFSVSDFKRELGSLTNNFQTLRIEGEDYRHVHHLNEAKGTAWCNNEKDLTRLSSLMISNKILEIEFDEFLMTLAKVHPVRIRKAIGNFEIIILHNVHQITHPHEALRFAYFIDKAYDNDVILLTSSLVPIENIFQRSYFAGGDTKKYLRTISRLKEMSQTSFLRLSKGR
jgi:cell division protein ZapE